MANPGLNLFPGPKFLKVPVLGELSCSTKLLYVHRELAIILQYSSWYITVGRSNQLMGIFRIVLPDTLSNTSVIRSTFNVHHRAELIGQLSSDSLEIVVAFGEDVVTTRLSNYKKYDCSSRLRSTKQFCLVAWIWYLEVPSKGPNIGSSCRS